MSKLKSELEKISTLLWMWCSFLPVMLLLQLPSLMLIDLLFFIIIPVNLLYIWGLYFRTGTAVLELRFCKFDIFVPLNIR